MGSLLNEEPKEVSRARSNSGLVALSSCGMVDLGL